MKNKVILTDCDGVLVDWVYAFDAWMARKGYKKAHSDVYALEECYGMPRAEMKRLVRFFNESAVVGNMPPLRDAIKYVKKLHEEKGYVFHCITSLSLEPAAAKLREKNIRALFGETAFEKVVCLDTGADKDDALLPYLDSGCVWVEDKIENADLGCRMGLHGVLMSHGHNEEYDGEATVVANWKEIYDML
jgi:beta-phosphoglucomutase-like phosphatase (HAD superfamily)